MRLEDARSRFVPGSHQPIRFDPPAGPAYLEDPALLGALQTVVEVAEAVRLRLRRVDRVAPGLAIPVLIEELTKRLGFARGEIVALPPAGHLRHASSWIDAARHALCDADRVTSRNAHRAMLASAIESLERARIALVGPVP